LLLYAPSRIRIVNEIRQIKIVRKTMDFTLNADQIALQDSVRKFAGAELPKLAKEVEATGTPPSHDLVKRYGEMGFLGVNLPSELGGLGLSHLDAVLVLEEAA